MSALANVIPLPTAAKRKVRQPSFQTRKYYRAKDELPEHPADFLTPYQREAMRKAETIVEIEKSAALLITTAIFQTLDRDKKAAVKGFAALLGDTDEGRQAVAWLDFLTANYGDSTMIKMCMKRVAAERGR